MARSITAAGMLAFPLALAASLLGLLLTFTRAARPATGRVELEVAGLLPMPEETSSILVLREKGTETILPLIVSGASARDLDRSMQGAKTTGVLGQAIQALGARVREVEIAQAEETPEGALIRLAQGAKILELTARPSESIALAVAAHAPIVTTRRILEEAGLSPADLEKARRRMGGGREKSLRL